jgi:hypothetical protein
MKVFVIFKYNWKKLSMDGHKAPTDATNCFYGSVLPVYRFDGGRFLVLLCFGRWNIFGYRQANFAAKKELPFCISSMPLTHHVFHVAFTSITVDCSHIWYTVLA